MNELDKATFTAIIAPIMSGIRTGNDGMRVQFDIPEVEMSQAAKLLGMRGKRLRVTIEVEPQENGRGNGRKIHI